MASYNELNALIDAYINRNGVQAITGQILNGVLKAMVEQLGRGYTIMGAATPTTDPGTPDGPECYFASETGTYTDFDGLQVVPGELALLCYTPSDGWTKATIYEGFRQVGATIDENVGTPSVGVSYANGVLSFDFRNMKGNTGDAAGFGTIGADITGGVGTPGVTVESSGPATAKNLQFHFTNLKGETGVTSVVATVDNTTGTPACTVSLEGQQLTLAFSGLKGAQGDTGSSVDYPFTIVNNLTTDDATQALSAAQGVVLDGKVTQLEAKVDGFKNYKEGVKLNTSGQEVADANYFISAKVPAVLGDSFAITDMQGYICSYQADGTFCDYWGARTNLTISGAANTNAAYILVSFKLDKLSTAQIEKGVDVVWKPETIKGINTKIAELQDAVEDMEEGVQTATEKADAVAESMQGIDGEQLAQNFLIDNHELEINGGKNYTDGVKLNTSGEQVADSTCLVTVKIPAAQGDTFNITSPGGYICVYKADGTMCDHWNARNSLTISGSWTANAAYIKFTFKKADLSTAKVENGDVVVWTPQTIVGIKSEVERLSNLLPNNSHLLHLTFTPDTESYILSPFNDTYDAKLYFYLKRSLSASHNQCFNFRRFCLMNKSTLAETNVDDCLDDIAPPNFNGGYLGGNHANAKVRKLTITGHGLSYANIGEVWNYGDTGEATILAIVDENHIVAVGKQTETYPKFNFETIPADAVLSKNETNLTVSASEVYQWYCATDTPDLDVFVDGKRITQDGDYPCNDVKVCEAYDIFNTQSVLEKLRLGVGTYNENPNPASFTTADKCTRVTIAYSFPSAMQWFVATTFAAYQDIDIVRFGYTQQGAIQSAKLYIPKALPVAIDNSTIDFRTAPNYPAHSNIIYLTSETAETPNLPPDRWLSANSDIAIHSGFLFDYGVGGTRRKDVVTNYFYLPSNLKIYPNGIDNKVTVKAGDSYSAINWRTFIDRATVLTGGVISVNKFAYEGKLYIYADFNQAGIYEIEIPDEFIGKTVEVFEKGDNVTLMNPISGRKILVKVDTASPMYGYLVAQIK